MIGPELKVSVGQSLAVIAGTLGSTAALSLLRAPTTTAPAMIGSVRVTSSRLAFVDLDATPGAGRGAAGNWHRDEPPAPGEAPKGPGSGPPMPEGSA